jgi:hypothetical protein
MKRMFIAAAVVVGLVVPASAATIDFTANNAKEGFVLGGIKWTASGGNGAGLNSGTQNALADAIHRTRAGCDEHVWTFVCASTGTSREPFDVGFGIKRGQNGEEIDGKGAGKPVNGEFVQILFGKQVAVTGFAGMLTYANLPIDLLPPTGSVPRVANREQVVLQYLKGDGTWGSVIADPKAAIGDRFDTVGLAFLQNLRLVTTTVRFRATGTGKSDDGSFNVTAAGLQVAAVPVPAGLPLLLTGLGVLVWGARRKKRMAA